MSIRNFMLFVSFGKSNLQYSKLCIAYMLRLYYMSLYVIILYVMRVKNDHRSEFSNLSNWKEEA